MNGRCALAAVGLVCGVAAARPVEVVYSRADGSTTSTVPGAVDLAGTPVATKFNTMSELWLSSDGTKFLLKCTTTQPSAESDNCLLLGAGTTGSIVLQEGRPFPGAVGSEVVDFISTLNPQPFNGHNDWAMAIRARGGTASVFNKILRYTGGVGELRFQMGDLYTGLTDVATATSGDERLGNSQAAVHLLNDGRIGWQEGGSIQNLSTFRKPAAVHDGAKYLQSNVDNVTTLDGTGSILLTNINSTGTLSVFITSPDGTRKVIRGEVDTDASGGNSTPDQAVVVVDGRVRIQEALEIPGQGITPTAIHQVFVAGNNDWYARGITATGAWAVRNGVVIAKSGDAVGADTWGTATFYTLAGNTQGDWVLAGKTTNANTAVDDVLVVNGQVVLREGDPVSLDLDGNGTMETVYVGRGNNALSAFVANSSVGLAPNRTVYILSYLHDADSLEVAPTGVAYALLRVTPANPCPADFNGVGGVTVQDIFDFLAAYFANSPSADFNHVGGVTVQDIFDFLAAYFAGCT